MKGKPLNTNASLAGTSPDVPLPPVRKDYLVFRLADREYGIALGKVQELCNYDIVKPARAGAPRSIAGIVILRCRNIPVVNLYEILTPGNPENGRLTDVVILDIGGYLCGMAVDCVIDVVAVRPDQVHATQAAGSLGIADLDPRVIVLLDADKLLTGFQPGPIDKLAA